MDLLEVMDRFPNQQACISHIEKVRWGDAPECPHCNGKHVGRRKEIAEGRLGRWNCHDCKVTFKVVHGTVFHGTKIPLQNLLARGNLQVPGSGHRLLGGSKLKWRAMLCAPFQAVCLYLFWARYA